MGIRGQELSASQGSAPMSFEICLGRLWVHRIQGPRYSEIPLAYLLPQDDIHGKLYFKIEGQIIPGLGYLAYDKLARDGACLIEWILYLNQIVEALLESEKAAYHFRGYDLGDFACEFVRDQDHVLFSLDGYWGAEPGWELLRFELDDLFQQYSAFKAQFLEEVAYIKPEAAKIWERRFLRD
jgi:hypothetical protein